MSFFSFFFFFSSRRRHTRSLCDWSSDVCSSDLRPMSSFAGGVPFTSDADLQAALDQAGVSEETATAVLEVNQQARLDGLCATLVVLAGVGLLALVRRPAHPHPPTRLGPG